MRISLNYRREDFDRVMEISDACYSGEYRPPREKMADMISVADVFVARITLPGWAPRPPMTGGLSDEDTIIGFAIVQNVTHPYIWNIAVDPDFQGRGVGGNILREIIRKYTLSKDKEISLHVDAVNPAQKLYFDHGFLVRSVEQDYFKPNDGLLMVRRLP